MPEISRFYGIVVKMYHREHNPPHVHAFHGGQEAVLDINTLTFRSTTLSRRDQRLLLRWASEHQPELQEDWRRAQAELTLTPIEPLH